MEVPITEIPNTIPYHKEMKMMAYSLFNHIQGKKE
jgi:hypothetical protein